MGTDDNELASRLGHAGVRVGEIIAFRAWLVIMPGWLRSGDDRLHSVFVRDYVWHPDEPASGDVRTHGAAFSHPPRGLKGYFGSSAAFSESLLSGPSSATAVPDNRNHLLVREPTFSHRSLRIREPVSQLIDGPKILGQVTAHGSVGVSFK